MNSEEREKIQQELIHQTQQEEELKKNQKQSLEEIDFKIADLKASGKIKKLLQRIDIDENGHFYKNRKHSEIPPLKTDLKEHEPTIWGFCRIPQLSEFDDTYKKNGKTYNELLIQDRIFMNPYAIHNMLLSYDINEYSSMLVDLSFPEEESYDKMRACQNKKWAEERLTKGVFYAKEGKFNDAIRCYSDAIELVPTYPEAYTARGAALSKLGKLKEAVMNFEAALKLDKNTPNAQAYKDKILAQINSSTVKNTTNSFSTTISSVKRSAPTPPTESSKKVDIDQKLLELLKKETERNDRNDRNDRSRSHSSHHHRHHRHHHH